MALLWCQKPDRQGGQLARQSTIDERVSGAGVLAVVALADARASDTARYVHFVLSKVKLAANI